MENQKLGKQFHFDNAFWDRPLPCGFVDLYQLGEISCEYGYLIEEHEQYVHEITYIISGSGTSTIDGEEVRLSEGDVLLCSMGHRHSIRASDRDILRFTYIGFRFRSEPDSPDMDMLQSCFRRPWMLTTDKNNVMFPFMRAISELYAKPGFWPLLLRSYCEQIVIQAARDFTAEQRFLLKNKRASRSAGSEVYKIIQYVEDNIETLSGVRQIAQVLGYNYTYLSHVFSNVTGITLQKYISQKKIERARQLLRYGDYTATKVAEMLNYESLQSFSKAFRRVMGITPSAYQAMELTHAQEGKTAAEQDENLHKEEG